MSRGTRSQKRDDSPTVEREKVIRADDDDDGPDVEAHKEFRSRATPLRFFSRGPRCGPLVVSGKIAPGFPVS